MPDDVVQDGSADLQLNSDDVLQGLDIPDNDTDDVDDTGKDAGDDDTGQQSDSPTDDKGQEPDSPTGTEKEGDKPPPYDQDPKWKEARAAQKRLNEILDDNGYDSVEDLVEDLREGLQIRDLIGDRDAEEVVEKAKTLEKYEEYWAQQEHERRKEEETPEETIERLEKEKKELLSSKQTEEEAEKERIAAQKEAQANLDRYEQTVTSIVSESEDLNETEQGLAKLLLGLENPAIDVDITDRKAVREMATSQMAQVTKMIQAIRQDAIDKYAEGKGKAAKTGKPEKADAAAPSTQKKGIPDDAVVNDATIGDFFTEAGNELLELISQQAQDLDK